MSSHPNLYLSTTVCERTPESWARPLIFLCGMARSGTSWLGKILDSHPDTLYRHEPDIVERLGEDGLISIDGIVDAFVYLHKQPRSAWSFEVDVRTSKETW